MVAGIWSQLHLLVAIDGHSGAGKSTVAAQLMRSLEGVHVVPYDDFYSPAE